MPPINTTNTPPTFARPSSLAAELDLDVSSYGISGFGEWTGGRTCEMNEKLKIYSDDEKLICNAAAV